MNETTITIDDAENGIIVAHISGQLDESNVDEKIKDLYKVVEQNPKGLKLLFDLEKLEYMNSKSIGYLTDLYGKITESGGKVAIAKAAPNIVDILQVVGLTQLINSYDTVDEAKNALSAESQAAPTPETAPAAKTPAEPAQPVTEAPAEPETPAEPAQPVTEAPTEPETPAEPAEPATPAPEASTEPETQAEPAPETPAEPAPEAPAEPAPETPAEPAPETPAEPAPEAPTSETPTTTPETPTPETPATTPETPAEKPAEGGTYKFGQ